MPKLSASPASAVNSFILARM
jgi:hypothetical protein